MSLHPRVLWSLLFTSLQPACAAEPAADDATGTLRLATVGWSPQRGALQLNGRFSVRGLSNGLSRSVVIERDRAFPFVDLQLPAGLYDITLNEPSELASLEAIGPVWPTSIHAPVPIAGVRAGSRTSVTLRIVEAALNADGDLRFDSLPVR
jgi:hypothetical protein